MVDEKKEILDRHIANFPTKFDNTSLAKQLRAENVTVYIYSATRDMWTNKKSGEENFRFLKIKVAEAISALQEIE